MVYSILSEARVRYSSAPTKAESVGYQVVWDENSNLKDWTTFINLDIVGAWGGFLFGTKRSSSGGFIGPANDIPIVDATINNRISFRMKYDKHPKSQGPSTFGKIQWTTVSDPFFDDTKSVTFNLIADGSWQLYEINMSDVNSWIGEVNNIRFFPAEDGFFNDEFFLGFFEIGSNLFDFSFDNPNSGISGFVEGSLILNKALTISKDVNDKLIVNIDDYGDVQITLTSQTAQPFIIARDISLQLSKVGVGGYPRAEAFITEEQKLRIESGTKDIDSSVVIKQGVSSAANLLGFVDNTGFFIGTKDTGTPPSQEFSPLSSYRPTTSEILSLFDNDSLNSAFSLNPQTPVVQGGNINYANTDQRITQEVIEEGRGTSFQGLDVKQTGALSSTGKTFVDLNHPFSDSGKIDKIFMNGIANADGSSKWKIFRPKLNGNLTLIAEGSIGGQSFVDNPNGGLVRSVIPDIFTADVSSQNIQVRRGDLLGIFNVSLHAGRGNSIKPDALYYSIDGDVSGEITPPTPTGAGERGLPIYARSSTTKKQAVIDIDLRRRLNIDSLKLVGFEEERDLEYNVATAASTVFNSETPGQHTICYVINLVTNDRDCFNRPNQGFNLQALNDGIINAENGVSSFGNGGVSGLGGADQEGATYFYVNGDGEFLDTFEFQGRAPRLFNFLRDPVGLECFFSNQSPRLDKPIGKVVMYFKERKNQRSWQLEHLVGTGGRGGNGSKPGFSIIPPESLTSIKIDDLIVEPSLNAFVKQGQVSLFLDNPVILDTVAGNGVRNPQFGVDFQDSVAEIGGSNLREQATFIEFQWNRFEWNFESIRTAAIRWFSDFHWSTKISEMEIFAVSESKQSLGDNLQVLFSSDGETFTTAEIENSNQSQANYKLGNSPQFLRLIFRPTLQTDLNDIQIKFEEDQVCFGPEGRITGSASLQGVKVGSFGESTPLLIENNTGQFADLIVDLPEDIQSAKQLLYFNRLNSFEDLQTPEVGPPAKVDFNPDKTLKEESNVAINATAYGLLNLVEGTGSFISDNLAINGGFENGDSLGWNIEIVNSGTLPFQIPRVADFRDQPGAASIQGDSSFSFGAVQHSFLFSQEQQFAPIALKIGQTHDISKFAESIDLGSSTFQFKVDYAHYGTGPNPTFKILGAPTVSGVNLEPGTFIDTTFGSNLLFSVTAGKSINVGSPDVNNNTPFELEVSVKRGTRYLRLEMDVDITGPEVGFQVSGLIFLLNNYSAFLNTPAITGGKWYKSYFTGIGDFTDSSFSPVSPSLFTAITGSNHWFQPARNGNSSLVPQTGQNPGFDMAFSQDRDQGVQSFSRMTSSNPGILGAQWEGEKKISGIRIAHSKNNTNFHQAQSYPRFWDIQVLKTKSELGGISPDINNPGHFKTIRQIRSVIRDSQPTQARFSASSGGVESKITTWVFSEPIFTEGIKVVYLLNCDASERQAFPDFDTFFASTGCPQNSLGNFTSFQNIFVSMFTPLESLGTVTLPIDDVPDRELTGGINLDDGAGGVVHTAVDLGRHFDLETNPDLLELISKTINQTPWPTSAIFGNENTEDPNQVSWTGNSSFARWIRFSTPAQQRAEWEPFKIDGTSSNTPNVEIFNLPQGILQQARIYPRIQTASVPTEGFNHFWKNLGNVLTDSNEGTLINYSEFPVVCLDLGRPYLLNKESSETILRRELSTPGPGFEDGDINYWQTENDQAFAYSNKSFKSVEDPSFVTYTPFGAPLPDNAIRWVAIRGVGPLLKSDLSSSPKKYNFETQGGILREIKFSPENPEVFTENPNWFSNSTSSLRDISTFVNTIGLPFSIQEGIDYGSNGASGRPGILGDPFFVWDGRFSIVDEDFWGIALRDQNTGSVLPDNDFPHSIWRIFRDPFRGEVLTKEIKAITIVGLDDSFHPTDFQIQKIVNINGDLNQDANWSTIPEATFSNVNTFNQGLGFTHIFTNPVETQGIRILITASKFPDFSASDVTNIAGAPRQNPIDRGPQTRLVSITIFEEVVETSTIQGNIETDHALSASVTSTTAVPDRGPDNLVDGLPQTFFQATGTSESITINLGSIKTINRFKWRMSENFANQLALNPISTNAPSTFRLKYKTGGLFKVILEEQDYSGLSFDSLLPSPIESDEFIFEVDFVQGQDTDASSVILHSLNLIEENFQMEPLVKTEEVFERRPGGTNLRSTKVLYPPDTTAVANLFLDGIDSGIDPLFSERDFFSFWLWINDIALLDISFGAIKIGNSRSIFYSWDIDLLDLKSGWNQLKLQFKNAQDRSEIPFESGPNFNTDFGETLVDFTTPDVVITSSVDGTFSKRVEKGPGIRFFQLQFRGTNGSKDLEFILDDFSFSRNKFEDMGRFLPSLYLNNSETMTVYLEGLDLSRGTVEFWLQPDWDVLARLDRFRDVIPSLFKITRPDGKYLTFFYRPGLGFSAAIKDNKQTIQFKSDVNKYQFERFDNLHVALVWDVSGRMSTTGATLRMWVNNEIVFGTNVKWDAVREGGTAVMFGGEVGQEVGSPQHNDTALTFTAVPTLPQENTASVWGLLENVKIYNYAKTDFSDKDNPVLESSQLTKPSDLVQVSLDNVNFYSSGSDNLPLVISNVPPNSPKTVYLRSNIPSNITKQENRDASLLVRWKTPFKKCD